MRRSVWNRAGLLLCCSSACIALGSLSGCYKRVVSAKGIGVDSRYPQRSESSEPEIDKAIDKFLDEKRR